MSWQVGCALVVWNVRTVEGSLGILHVLSSFIPIHNSPTISGPSECCVLWCVLPASLFPSSLPLCRRRGNHRPRAFEVGRNGKEKFCLFSQFILLFPRRRPRPWTMTPNGRISRMSFYLHHSSWGSWIFLFFIWSRNDSVQTLDGEIHPRAWEGSSRGPPPAQHFNLIFRPEQFHWVRGNWVLPLPTVGNWRNDPVSLWESNRDRQWDFKFIMQGRPCTHW